MDKIKKSLGYIRAVPDNVEETRTVQFVISSARKDRHGTILDLDGWDLESYNRNPIVGYQHDVYGDSFLQSPNPDSVIGMGRVFREGDELIGEVKFEPSDINPLADKILKKVKFGTLRATSVGFLPVAKGKWGQGEESRDGSNPTYYYGKRELLEFSIVNIPSNSDALVRKLEDEMVEPEEEETKETQKPTDVPDYERVDKLIRLTKIQ